jgi:circadian clock protein KaiC
MRLTGWQATTFLVGEFQLTEAEDHPVFTVADGLVGMYQSLDRNSMVRKMQVMKMRGQAPIPGLHTFRITNRGIQVFPRLILALPKRHRWDGEAKTKRRPPRVSVGVTGLDEMLGGGIPSGQSVLVAGPSGSGKTVLATQFIREGVRRGEPGVIAIFEKRPSEYAQTSAIGLDQAVRDGQVGIIHTRPLDLSIDETQHELTTAIERLKARRVVIDSLSGFELALAPTFREDFRESLYRLVAALDRDGRHCDDDRGVGRHLHAPSVQPARDRVSDRRDHPAAISRARRSAAARDGSGEGPRECPQQRPAPV